MKTVIIYGNARQGSTWHITQLFKRELSNHDDLEIEEFTLPRDLPNFCLGCFSCFQKGEQTCPHSSSVAPIVNAFKASDLIILSSPVYAMDVSGQMKALLDHLCFMWMSHRPSPQMFHKIGLIVTTTAGAGLTHANKTLKNSLNFWGIKRIFSMSKAVSASSWNEIPDKKRLAIENQVIKLSKRLIRTQEIIDQLHPPLFARFFFPLMKRMMKKNTWNLQDRNHWVKEGWLEGKSPF